MSARDEAAGGVELLPCPFCGGVMMFRKALWPSDGNTDAIIHAGPSVCGLAAFDVGTADESVIPIWNRRAPSPRDQACSAMLGSAAVAAPFENEQTPSPAAVAAAIIEWDRRGRLVDDESYVQNNAPTVARAYYDLREVSSAMLGALEHVRVIIVDAASVGFNPIAGNWPERLFASQRITKVAADAARSAGIETEENG